MKTALNGHTTPLILSAKNVEVKFNLRGKTLTAVRGASLDLYKGETLAIVGESGCGKSVFTKSFIGMLDKNGYISGGSITYDGEDMAKYTAEQEWLKVRGKKIAMVFQDPMTSLNPVRTIGEQITEVITWHFGTEHEQAKREAIELLKRVGIADAEYRYKQYPNEFSGGMRQRVVIATAIACRPEILICDEPTTALDVTVQAQIIRLIKELQKELDMTVVYITHDLGVVASVADWVGVMYAGQIIEYGTVHEIFKQPAHPYTKALLMSLPQLGVKGNDLYSIKGAPPNLFKKIEGDAFAPRNPEAMEIDFEQEPPRFDITPTHWAKTWLLYPYAEIYRKELDSAEHKRKISVTKPEKPFGYKNAEKLLQVKNLSVNFKLGGKEFKAVDSVSFDIYKGETLSLVGESGSGKTTIGRAIMRKIEGLRMALDLTAEWDKLDNGSALITGVIVARRDVVEANPGAGDSFLQNYAASVEGVNGNTAEAAALVGEYGIVDAAVAEKALPYCNIVCLTGGEMKDKLSGYLKVLSEAEPSSVGGTLPGDDFYYGG